MTELPPIKGRQPIGALIYYHCPACGAPQNTSIYNCGFDGVEMGGGLLTDEGALFFFREGFTVNLRGIQLTREVGRIACPDDEPHRVAQGDHVFYDWEFTAADRP